MMRKYLLTAAVAIGALSVAGAAAAQTKYTFALVPKNMNNPFFDQARDGCKKAEAESNGAFECMYIGPGEHGGGEEQVQIVQDLVAKKVDGIAVAPANAAAMAVALQAAKDAGIPVLTWDSDVLPENKDLRIAYIGTHNYEIGVNLAKLAQKIKPSGGTIVHPVGWRGSGQSQRAHAGHPRHAVGREVGRFARRAADRTERLDGNRRLPALHRRRLPAVGAAV